jgi:aspartate/methionine/tyrosine aminotransferase
MRAVQAPVIPQVGALLRAHPGAISLGQGVVHYGPPPEALRAAATIASRPELHKYHGVEGLAELRAALAEKLARENGMELDREQRVVVTAGGNMAFFAAVVAIVDAGDEVILPAPYYFNHEMAVRMLHGEPVVAGCCADYQLDVAAIERAITPRTRAVVTVSPNNPSGAVYREADLRAVNLLCRERGLYHLSDEAYEYFTYGGAQHFSPGSIAGSGGYTLSLYSFSKAYGMAGWRVGYLVLPERLLKAVHKALDTILICPGAAAQLAACGALKAGADYWRPRVAALAEVRAAAVAELERVKGCRVSRGEGAFYLLVQVDTELAPLQLVERLVREHGVGVLPGTTFGLDQGCTLRVAYGALDRDTVAEGIGRLGRGLAALGM